MIEEPQSLVSLATAVGAPVPAVRQAVESLVEDYDGLAGGPRRGFELREVGGGWRLYVREEHDDLISEFVNAQAPSKLSQAALETLAVIAYKQPVTPRSGRVDPRGERRFGGAHAPRARADHRGVQRPRDGRDPLRHDRCPAREPRHQFAGRASPHLAAPRRRRERLRRGAAMTSRYRASMSREQRPSGASARKMRTR